MARVAVYRLVAVSLFIGSQVLFLMTDKTNHGPDGHGPHPAQAISPLSPSPSGTTSVGGQLTDSQNRIDAPRTDRSESRTSRTGPSGEPVPADAVPRTDVPRILVADENPDTRAQIQQLLEPYYEVIAVADGQAALDLFYQRPPDLVLSDITLPRLDGIQLLRTLKSRPDIGPVPVVLLSDKPVEEIGIDVSAIGADDVLIKPALADELLTRVRAQLEQARVRRQADDNLRAIVAQAPFAIGVLRGADFVVEMANEQQLSMWGRSAEQMLNKPFFEAVPEAVGQGFDVYLNTVLTMGETVSFSELVVVFPTPDGLNRKAYVNCTLQPLREPNGVVSRVMAVSSDVTETVLARRVISDNANRLQALFEQAPVAVAIVGPGPDLVFELANPSYCQIAGRTVDQLVGKPLLVTMPELIGKGFDTLLVQVMATGVPYANREAPVELMRNGKLAFGYFDFVYQPRREDDGRITGVIAIATDITETVQARQRVEANERLLNAMIRQTPLGVAIYRAPDSVVELSNPVMSQILGRTAEEVLNKSLFETSPELIGQGFEEILAEVYRTGIPFEGRELPATLNRNGQMETAYFDFIYEPLIETHGNIERVMVVSTDVTATRKARLAIERANARLRDFFEQAPVAIGILRGPEFVVEMANPGICEFWNRPLDQQIGRAHV